MASSTIAGRIIELTERGYTPKEILAELSSQPGYKNLSLQQIRYYRRKINSASMDSRRIFEIWEMLHEVLATLREVKAVDQRRLAVRMRSVEKGLANSVGQRIEDDANPVSPA